MLLSTVLPSFLKALISVSDIDLLSFTYLYLSNTSSELFGESKLSSIDKSNDLRFEGVLHFSNTTDFILNSSYDFMDDFSANMALHSQK